MEEEEKSWRDARSNVRTGLGLGFEIAANTGLDIFSFVPGSQQAGSAFINYLAQKIRGGPVSKGEILAAAATSQIPGLTQAKALTKAGRLTRSVAKGSIAGGVTSTSMSLVDEGKLPSFGEFATGVTAGGVMGGAFDLAPAAVTGKLGKEIDDIKFDSSVFLKQLKSRVKGEPVPINPSLYRSGQTIFGEGTIGAAKPIKWRYVPPDADASYKINQKLFNDAALENGNFSLKLYEKGKTNEAWRRKVGINYQTNPQTRVGWEKTKKELRHNWEALYGTTMQRLGYSTSDIEIEHIFTLQQSMPIYEGVRFGSPLYNEIQEYILNRGYAPGNTEKNLMAILPHLHQQKTNYFNALHGKDGKRFFTQDIIDEMVKSKKFRFEMIDKYLDEVDMGKKILDDALEVFDTLNIEGKGYMPEELAERLGKLELNDYSAPELKAIFAEFEAEGFKTNPKVTAKIEADEIKAEKQAAAAKAKKQKQLDKDRISVDKLREKYDSAPIDEFTNPYELNMKDEILRETAEEAYKEFKELKLTYEGPQQGSLFETEDREAWIKRYMRRTLDKIKRELKKNKKKK